MIVLIFVLLSNKNCPIKETILNLSAPNGFKVPYDVFMIYSSDDCCNIYRKFGI